MKKSFLNKIRKNEISHPLHKSFKIEKWIQAFKEHLEAESFFLMQSVRLHDNEKDFEYESYSIEEESNVFFAGITFYLFLEEIRKELNNL